MSLRFEQNTPKARRRFAKGALPVKAAYLAIAQRPESGAIVPYLSLRIDASTRPDVADLHRVHASENTEGNVTTAWTCMLSHTRRGAIARFDVTVHRPVRCEFAVIIPMDTHWDALEAAAASGVVGITTKRRQDGRVLCFESDATELARSMHLLRTSELIGGTTGTN